MQSLTQNSGLYRHSERLMGNRFGFSVLAENEEAANAHTEAAVNEIRRIEKLLTTFSDDSQTNRINAQAGIKPVEVDREVLGLIQRSIKISALTQGAFDITYGSVDKRFWNFDTTMTSLPDRETARKAVALINYRNVVTDEKNCTVFLKRKGMRIGFGGIGKGYAAECAKRLLKSRGVSGGIVNAAGDLTTWGTQADGRPWTIGIASPSHEKEPFSHLTLKEAAVATSGTYEKFVTIGGRRYSHTIDPKTGMPVSGIASVTIISPNAEIADAMATPVMVMGVTAGLHMINQVKGLGCIIIDDSDRIFTSKNIRLVP